MRYLTLVIVLFAVSAFGASGDWYSPSANYDPGAWTSCDQAYHSDDSRAAAAATLVDSFAVLTFAISITATDIVDSVDVSVEGFGGSATTARRVHYVALSTDGGVSKSGNWATDTLNQTTDAVSTLAGTSNGQGDRTWGATLTGTNVGSSNFAVMIKKTINALGATQNIDQVRVRVWWHAGSGFTGNRRSKIINMGLTKSQ